MATRCSSRTVKPVQVFCDADFVGSYDAKGKATREKFTKKETPNQEELTTTKEIDQKGIKKLFPNADKLIGAISARKKKNWKVQLQKEKAVTNDELLANSEVSVAAVKLKEKKKRKHAQTKREKVVKYDHAILMEMWSSEISEISSHKTNSATNSSQEEDSSILTGVPLWSDLWTDSPPGSEPEDTNLQETIAPKDVPVMAQSNTGRHSRHAAMQSNRSRASEDTLQEDLAESWADPHVLVAPYSFGQVPAHVSEVASRQQPFIVHVHPQVTLVADLHAHMCNAEVIGLLAGRWDATKKCLYIQSCFPCFSTIRVEDDGSTDVEMDPGAEIATREAILRLGLQVVGWYHSHPSFRPDPSTTDIINQHSYQQLFRDAETNIEPFVGLIVSTFDPQRTCCESLHQWFHTVPFTSPLQTKKATADMFLPMKIEVRQLGAAPGRCPVDPWCPEEERRAMEAKLLSRVVEEEGEDEDEEGDEGGSVPQESAPEPGSGNDPPLKRAKDQDKKSTRLGSGEAKVRAVGNAKAKRSAIFNEADAVSAGAAVMRDKRRKSKSKGGRPPKAMAATSVDASLKPVGVGTIRASICTGNTSRDVASTTSANNAVSSRARRRVRGTTCVKEEELGVESLESAQVIAQDMASQPFSKTLSSVDCAHIIVAATSSEMEPMTVDCSRGVSAEARPSWRLTPLDAVADLVVDACTSTGTTIDDSGGEQKQETRDATSDVTIPVKVKGKRGRPAKSRASQEWKCTNSVPAEASLGANTISTSIISTISTSTISTSTISSRGREQKRRVFHNVGPPSSTPDTPAPDELAHFAGSGGGTHALSGQQPSSAASTFEQDAGTSQPATALADREVVLGLGRRRTKANARFSDYVGEDDDELKASFRARKLKSKPLKTITKTEDTVPFSSLGARDLKGRCKKKTMLLESSSTCANNINETPSRKKQKRSYVRRAVKTRPAMVDEAAPPGVAAASAPPGSSQGSQGRRSISLVAGLQKDSPSAVLARQLVCSAAPVMQGSLLAIVTIGFYYSQHERRTILSKPWRKQTKMDKLRTSITVWLKYFGLAAVDEQRVLDEVIGFLEVCWGGGGVGRSRKSK